MKRKKALDRLVSIASYIYPLSGLPQVILVYKGNAAGVSLASWISFTCFAALFLAYGIVHKVKPMVVIYLLWLIIYSLIVIGLLIR